MTVETLTAAVTSSGCLQLLLENIKTCISVQIHLEQMGSGVEKRTT